MGLVLFFLVPSALQSPVLGGQEAVEFFDQSEEFFAVLFHRDQ